MSGIAHILIFLLLAYGLPEGTGPHERHPTAQGTPISLEHPLPKLPTHQKKLTAQEQQQKQLEQQPPPPPPMKEVELGPKSDKPDAPAKEAAAKKSDQEAANTATTKSPDPKPVTPPPPLTPSTQQKAANPSPPAPQRIEPPKLGDYASNVAPHPVTSPFGPQRQLDTASAGPPPEPVATTAGSMGRTGLSSHDPNKWENSFDDETAGQCPEMPNLGKNADGTPVLATVQGRVLDTDGRSPLSGAHLQIMGTQFGTFSGPNGEYVLAFDPSLLQKCRRQYVNVVAPGYRGEQLSLMIGPRVRSPDLVLHHGR